MRLGISNLFRRRPEVRESYTDQIISRLVSASAGVGDGSALAVVEVAARWWGAGLSSARIKPDNIALRSVSPAVLDSIGRQLVQHSVKAFM